MNKRYLKWLCVVGMVCVVLVMAVSGGTVGNPFGSGVSWGLGVLGGATPTPGAGGEPTPTPTREGGGYVDVTPTPEPSYAPTPTPERSYVIHLYVESMFYKYSDYVVNILVVGDVGDVVTVWMRLEGETGAYLLFTETLDEFGTYMRDYDVGEGGVWVFWATSATGASAEVTVDFGGEY